MRILVIGGTSFIGPHVVNQLIRMDHEVVVYHRGETNIDFPKSVRHILGDRKNMNQFTEEYSRFSPDAVIDMIPSTEKDAEMLIETFTGITPRVIAISSQDVYRAYGLVNLFETGELEHVPITEKSKLRTNLYPYQNATKEREDWCNNYDKILVERKVLETSAFASTVLRLPAVYGPRDNQHRFFSYLNLMRIKDKRPYIIMDESFANWHWTHSYVENVAHSIVTATVNSQSSGKVYNVGEPVTPSMKDFVKEIGKSLNWDGEIILLPSINLPEQLQFPLDTMQQLIVDSGKIREDLGYQEIFSRNEALVRTIEWEIQNMPNDLDSRYSYSDEDEVLKKIGLLY